MRKLTEEKAVELVKVMDKTIYGIPLNEEEEKLNKEMDKYFSSLEYINLRLERTEQLLDEEQLTII